MTIYIVGIIVCALCALSGGISYVAGKSTGYWEGRGDGWKACETMVMQRADEKGYVTREIWEDLLQ